MLQYARRKYPSSPIYVFARDAAERRFARELGAGWSGDIDEPPPGPCHAIIDTTPAWRPVLAALGNLRPGGRLVINAIRKEAKDASVMAAIRYEEHLWREKEIKTVANVTARDIAESLALAASFDLEPEVETFSLEAANEALRALKLGGLRGAEVAAYRNPGRDRHALNRKPIERSDSMRTGQAIAAAAALAAAIVTCGLPAVAVADDDAYRRSISVSGTGEAMGATDLATVNVGVQTVAPAATEAASKNEAAVARLMQALEEEGIEKKDIQTVEYAIWPEQNYDPREGEQPRITGYRVNNSVHVTVRDIERVGAVLGAVTTAGANSVNGISFGIDDPAALEGRAREAAMRDARAKAESLATLAGVQLGDVLQISLSSGGGYPIPMAMARMEMADAAMKAPSISTGESSVSVQVQVTYAIR